MGERKPILEGFILSRGLMTLSGNFRLANIVCIDIACLCVKGELSPILVSIFLDTRERKENDITFW